MTMTEHVPALPAGATLRRATYDLGGQLLAADLDALTDLVRRSETEAIGTPDSTRAEVQETVGTPDVVRAETYLVEVDGRAVGGGWFEADGTAGDLWSETYVDPGFAGAGQLREILVDRAVAIGRGIVGDRTGWTLRAGAYQSETEYLGLLAARGYTRARRFWRMEIDSTDPAVPGSMPAPPDGVSIDTGDDPEHRRALYEVDKVAFADHWHYVPRSYEDIWERVELQVGARGDYWWLVRVDGDPAGLCLLNDSRLDAGQLYVDTLGIAPAYRRRGLASLLLRRAFVTAREAGLSGTALHVDAQSVTGATDLYESVGMTPTRVIDSLELVP